MYEVEKKIQDPSLLQSVYMQKGRASANTEESLTTCRVYEPLQRKGFIS